MLAQLNISTDSSVLGGVLAVFFFLLWIVLIALFIEMSINVRRIRTLLEDRSRPLPTERA